MIEPKVDGVKRSFDSNPPCPPWYLRDILGLTGPKFGCGMALWRLPVHQNGKAIRSCIATCGLPPETKFDHRKYLSDGLQPVRTAWMEVNVPQCGYCQSGQIMQAGALLHEKPHPTDADIDDIMTATCPLRQLPADRAAIETATGERA